MLKIKSKKELENLIEWYLKEAYSDKDYLRAYNLLKLLVKVNPNNKVATYYFNLLSPSLLKKTRSKWVWERSLISLLKEPKIYFWVWLFILLNKLR